MNRTYAFAAAAALVFAMAAPATAQLKVKASGSKKVTITDRVGVNQFTWSSDAPLEKIKGTADGVAGSFTVDPTNIAGLRGSISAQVATMKSGNGTRDGHLKGAQWLDAAKYPLITFTIGSVSNVRIAANKATGTATGTFTMHGVAKQISIPFTMTWLDESPATRKRAPGDLVMIEATFSVTLRDFNVAGSQGLVGSKVGETIDISAKLFGSTK